MDISHPPRYAFFGTGPLAESVLMSLFRAGYVPALVVTKPDTPQGRNMELKSPHIKIWCDMKEIPVYQPETLRDLNPDSPLLTTDFDVFIIASYGKILPDEILNLPTHGALNVHPSLLPLYRGASPIESALLDGTMTTGVSIIKLDKEMDHGPILVQTAFIIDQEATAGTMEVHCGQIGGELLTQVLPTYLEGSLTAKEQDHSKATFCSKIEKATGEIKLTDDAGEVQRKYRALTPWPGLFFFITHKEKQIRIKVSKVNLTETKEQAKEVIEKVIPEGRNEISWADFERGYLK